MENVERTTKVRYELFSKALGLLVLKQEPKGYNDDTRSYQRDKNSRGILIKTKIKLEFFGDSAEYLTNIFTQFGISEKVLLTKFVRDTKSLSESWKFRYTQKLDMGKLKETSRQGSVTVDATEGGLFSDINNRKSNKYDLINQESADGIDIGVLKTKRFIPQPRGIFTDSLLRDDTKGEYKINSATGTGIFNYVRTVPNEIVYNTMPEDVKQAWLSDNTYNDSTHPLQSLLVDPGNLFFYQSEIDRTLRIKIDITFRITRIEHSNVTQQKLKVEIPITAINENNQDVLVGSVELLNIDSPQTKEGQEFTVSYNNKIKVFTGQSLGCVFNTEALATNGYMIAVLSVQNSKIQIIDETVYDVTESRIIKPFDLFERVVAKITGKNNLFKSTVFGEGGEYENMVVDNGFFARGFPNAFLDDNGIEKTIQFNTSFQDAFNSYNYLEPLAWFIEIDGGKEVVRIEKATHTMKNFIGLRLTSVDNILNDASKIDFFSKIVLGHKKSVEYEQVNGLEEPNGKSEFSTHITDTESEYSVISEYRFDSIGYELTRRFQFSSNPQKDTKFDDNIWMHDAQVDSEGIYTHNLWADKSRSQPAAFDSAPTGIFDPETAWNLWLSPMNRLFYGHGYSVKRGLYHFRSAKIRFASSNSNNNLRTVIGGFELHEGGNITISDIEKSRIEASKTNLNFRMTQEIEDTLLDFTEVDGEPVPNYFGLIEYLEKGDLRYGRLTKLDGDSESKLTIQKARL